MLRSYYDKPSQESYLYRLESKWLDTKFRFRGPLEPAKKVGVLAIDEASLNALGRWPLSRRVYQKVFSNLKELGSSWVGLDVIYSEPEASQFSDALPVLKQMLLDQRLNLDTVDGLDDEFKVSRADQMFSQALVEYEKIVQGYFFYEGLDSLGAQTDISTLESLSMSEIAHDLGPWPDLNSIKSLKKSSGVASNIPLIRDSSAFHAFFNNQPDIDSINRWLGLVANVEGLLMPSLVLQLASAELERMPYVRFGENGVTSLSLINPEDETDILELPIDPWGQARMLISHLGPEKYIPHFSFLDAYQGSFSEEQKKQLEGRVLIMGPTATGINDIRPNPFDNLIDGVENHAAALESILTASFIHKPSDSLWMEITILISFGLFATLTASFLSVLISSIFFLVCLCALLGFDYYGWFLEGSWYFVGLSVVQGSLIFIFISAYRYLMEAKEKAQVRDTFQRYLSPEVIDEMLDSPEAMQLGGKKMELTVFFSDVRSFTSISEGLSPEQLVALMNAYFTPMTDIILRSKGVLDKFIGDAVMAFWGAPMLLENSAAVACQAALDMLVALDQLKVDFLKKGWPAIDIGIGLNTGLMAVGNMGSNERLAYTVMGDAVNLGSRLEGLTKEYGIKIMISEFTRAKLDNNSFFIRNLDDIRVKGKNEPVRVFDLMRPDALPRSSDLREFVETFDEARLHYTKQNWDQAEKLFTNCLQIKPDDKAVDLYLERVETFKKEHPGEAWDGVFTFTHK